MKKLIAFAFFFSLAVVASAQTIVRGAENPGTHKYVYYDAAGNTVASFDSVDTDFVYKDNEIEDEYKTWYAVVEDGGKKYVINYKGVKVCCVDNANYLSCADTFLVTMKRKDGKPVWSPEPFKGELSVLFSLYNINTGKAITKDKYSQIILATLGEEDQYLLFQCNLGGSYVADNNSSGGVILDGGKYGYIDKNGNEVIPMVYDKASPFVGTTATVEKDGETLLVTNPLSGGNYFTRTEVDTDIPETGRKNDETFAFIISIEDYPKHIATGALNDGKVFGDYCLRTLGLPKSNIRYFENATYGNIVSALSKISDIDDAYEGDAKFILYYSGLGATYAGDKSKYLLPADYSFPSLTSTGYPVETLYRQLAELQSRCTVVFMDASFSGADREGKMLSEGRGIRITPKKDVPSGNLVVFSSVSGNEASYASAENGHGFFTYYLLDKLRQSAGRVTLKELSDYITIKVKQKSLEEFDAVQSPQVTASQSMQGKWEGITL